MEKYLKIAFDSFNGFARYMWESILNPSWDNYFYFLILVSLFVYSLELLMPWRKNQSKIRSDFWQDVFYMFFNFFIFSLIAFNAISNICVELFNDFLGLFGIENVVAISVASWSVWLQFLFMFLLADFIQWLVHVLLHRIPKLWEFHKVHHSVKEMGFAAHLRYHWMESIIYKTALYLPLTMIGFGITDLFYLHAFTILIGHLNHANIRWDYGPLKYIFNNPHMHIWHHAKQMPDKHRYGINFGISLSVWDYIFKTAYVPSSGRDIELGFNGIEEFPESFLGQMKEPFKSK